MYPIYQPAWLTDELNKALGGIAGHNARKKRITVLRLAEGEAIGRTQQETFRLPDTCAWKTWDGPYRGGVKKPGWRHDPDIQAALEAATERALWYQDQADGRRIAKRQEDVALARDKLAELALPSALKLGVLLGAENVETARRAANDILDRADQATATKSSIDLLSGGEPLGRTFEDALDRVYGNGDDDGTGDPDAPDGEEETEPDGAGTN